MYREVQRVTRPRQRCVRENVWRLVVLYGTMVSLKTSNIESNQTLDCMLIITHLPTFFLTIALCWCMFGCIWTSYVCDFVLHELLPPSHPAVKAKILVATCIGSGMEVLTKTAGWIDSFSSGPFWDESPRTSKGHAFCCVFLIFLSSRTPSSAPWKKDKN